MIERSAGPESSSLPNTRSCLVLSWNSPFPFTRARCTIAHLQNGLVYWEWKTCYLLAECHDVFHRLALHRPHRPALISHKREGSKAFPNSLDPIPPFIDVSTDPSILSISIS